MNDTIADLRKERGFATQGQFARAAKVSLATVKNIERGAAGNVSGRTLRGLANALGVDLNSIDRLVVRRPARRSPKQGRSRSRTG